MICPAKDPSDRSTLPNPQDFAKALYTFDIGQNDLSVGFRKLSFDQIRAALPDILSQLATAVRVSSNTIICSRSTRLINCVKCEIKQACFFNGV